jgi:hypothetical protein
MSKENIITQIKKNSNEVYRISEKEYEGYRFIDVRIYYQDRKTQEWKPTSKGISIMPNNVEDTTDFVGTIFYPNLCIACIIKLGKK